MGGRGTKSRLILNDNLALDLYLVQQTQNQNLTCYKNLKPLVFVELLYIFMKIKRNNEIRNCSHGTFPELLKSRIGIIHFRVFKPCELK